MQINKNNMNNKLSIFIVALVIIGGVIFAYYYFHSSKTTLQETSIKEIALIMPIAAGKTDMWIQTHKELMGPRYESYATTKQRFDIESQVSFLQRTPTMGDFELLYMKSFDTSNIKEVFRKTATSEDEESVYWRKLAGDLHSVDFTQRQSSTVFPDSSLAFSMSSEDSQNTQSLMFAIPVNSGRIAGLNKLSSALAGERYSEYTLARKNIGLTSEKVFMQSGSAGQFLVFYWLAENPKSSLEKFMSSTDPFDIWLRSELEGLNSIGLRQLADIFGKNVQAVQYPKK